MACRSAKKLLNPRSFGGYSFFESNESGARVQIGACRVGTLRFLPFRSLFLHQFGANCKAGARAPGFFVRVRFVGACLRASPYMAPQRVILRVV